MNLVELIDYVAAHADQPAPVRVTELSGEQWDGWLVSVFRRRDRQTLCAIEDRIGRIFCHPTGRVAPRNDTVPDSDWNAAIEAAAARIEARLQKESGPDYGLADESERADIRDRNRSLAALASLVRTLKREQ